MGERRSGARQGISEVGHLTGAGAEGVQNEAGQPVQQYIVHRCWVSEFQSLPDLDAGGNAIAVEHIKLEHEGWERDLSIGEPDQSKT